VKGEVEMKKSLIGIAILLFAILLQQCSAGMEIFTLTIGLVGLTTTIFYGVKSDQRKS